MADTRSMPEQQRHALPQRRETAIAAERAAERRGAIRIVRLPASVVTTQLVPPPGLRWHEAGATPAFSEWASSAVAKVLPPDALCAADEFGAGRGPPILLLRGLGTDEGLAGTDAVAAQRNYIKQGQRSETWLLGLAHRFGPRPLVSLPPHSTRIVACVHEQPRGTAATPGLTD